MSVQQNQLKIAISVSQNELITKLYPILQNKITVQFLEKFRHRSLETKELEELNSLNEEEFREFSKLVQSIHLEEFSKSERECIGIAQFNLGKYFHYVAKKQKLETALQWYLCSANNHCAEAQNKVGEFLEFNFGLAAYPMKRNQEKMTRSERMRLALSWYEKAKENNQLSVDAYYNLGRFKYFCIVYSVKMTELKYSESHRKTFLSETIELFKFAKEQGHQMAAHYYYECFKRDFRLNLYYPVTLMNFRKSKENLAKIRAENPNFKPAIDDDLIFNCLIDQDRMLDKDQFHALACKKKLDNYQNEFLFYTIKFYEKEAESGNQLAMVRMGLFNRRGIDNDKFTLKKDLQKAYQYYKRAADLESLDGIYWLVKIQIDNPNVEFVPNQSRMEWQLSNMRRLEDSGLSRTSYVLALFEHLKSSNIPRLIAPRVFELERGGQNHELGSQNHKQGPQNNEPENQNNKFSILVKACSDGIPKAAFQFWLFLVQNPKERLKINKVFSCFLEKAIDEEDGEAFYYLAMELLKSIINFPKQSISCTGSRYCERTNYFPRHCNHPIHSLNDFEEPITRDILINFLSFMGLHKKQYDHIGNYWNRREEDIIYISEQFQQFILSQSVLSLLRRASELGCMEAQKELVKYLFIKTSINEYQYSERRLDKPYAPRAWYRESLYWLQSYNVDADSINQIFMDCKDFWPRGVVNIIISYLEFDQKAIQLAVNQQQICLKHLKEHSELEEQYLEGLKNSVLENHFPNLHKLKNLYDPLEYHQILSAIKTELKSVKVDLGMALKDDLLLSPYHYERMLVTLVHQEIERIDMLMSSLSLPNILIFVITAYERGFSCVSSVKKGFDLQFIQRQLEEERKTRMELDAMVSVEQRPTLTFLRQESQSRFPSFEPEQDEIDEFENDFKVTDKGTGLHI